MERRTPGSQPQQLIVLIDGRRAAEISAGQGGRLQLVYAPAWRESADAYPLSVSLPLSAQSHTHRSVLSFLWNLLPEDPAVLKRWGLEHGVSPANPLRLLAHVGADAAGAALLVPPERLEEIRSATPLSVIWLSEAELEERLNALRRDSTAMRLPGDAGHMTLAGAQAKTALYHDPIQDRWGVPAGGTPSTHIIKPCIPGFDGLVENEHFCTALAARLKLPAARTTVLTLDASYIVAERYDRQPCPGAVQRLHQEDLCQALGLMPQRKYQQDGGPDIAQIVALLRQLRAPESDVDQFLKANVFAWLTGGTDAHAKNYSLLLSAGGQVRLAPLYDLSSQLPYPERIKPWVAMKIGKHYDIALIGAGDWRRLAQACTLEEDRVIGAIDAMAAALPDHVSELSRETVAQGLPAEVIAPLAAQLIANSQACWARISRSRSTSHGCGTIR